MNILDDIVQAKREEVAQLRRTFSRSSFTDFPSFHSPTAGFIRSLKSVATETPPAIIAEVKRASPSAGTLSKLADPTGLAAGYAANGAAALSILTDTRYFSGSVEDLSRVRERLTLPLLRKDFFIDEYQVLESRARGADAILLIAAILARTALDELHGMAVEMGMDVLVEIHRVTELEKIDFSSAKLVGINNRNLADMTVDTGNTARIAPHIPPGVPFVSESGLRSAEDIRSVLKAGASAVLIGEYFMKNPDPGRRLKEVLSELREN